MDRLNIKRLAVFAGLAIWAGLASAAQQGLNGSAAEGMTALFTPSDSDLTKTVLMMIFGDWSGDSQAPMMGEAMSYYNASVMMFGVLLYTFLGTISVVQTAKDGVLLGKKLSATWIPIRFVAAMALLIPLSSGYSRIQSLALDGAVLGGGSASVLWKAMASSTIAPVGELKFGDQQKYFTVESSVPGTWPALDTARAIFKALVCVEHHNQAAQASGVGEAYSVQKFTQEEKGVSRIDQIRFGSADGNATGHPECGAISGPTIDLADDFQSTINRAPSTNSTLSSWQSIVSTVSAAKPIQTERGTLINVSNQQMSVVMQMAQMLRGTAAKQAMPDGANSDGSAVQSTHVPPEQVAAQVKAAADMYERAMKPVVEKLTESMSRGYERYVDETSKFGWMMAGASIYRISAVRSKLSEAISTASTPKLQAGDDSNPAYAADDADVASLSKVVDADQNVFERWVTSAAQSISRNVTVDPVNPTHAIIQLKQNGDTLVNIGSTVFAAGMTAKAWGDSSNDSAPTWFVKKLPVVGTLISAAADALAVLGPLMLMMGGTLLLCGFTMAYIIPLLPFITSIGNIVGWLMATYSAVIAAPAWMAAHFHPNGDELTGRGAGGYMIMLETVFRPAFLVMGLVGGYKISDAAIRVFSFLSPIALGGLQVHTAVGLFSLFVFVGFNVASVLYICRSCMKFSDTLQHKVFTWIGGAHAGYDAGQEMAGGIERSTAGFQGNASKAHKALDTGLDILNKERGRRRAAGGSGAGSPDRKEEAEDIAIHGAAKVPEKPKE